MKAKLDNDVKGIDEANTDKQDNVYRVGSTVFTPIKLFFNFCVALDFVDSFDHYNCSN